MDRGEFVEYFCSDEKNDTDIYVCLASASFRSRPPVHFLGQSH